MRRFFNIFAVAALLLSLASCKRDGIYEDDVTPPEDIILPAGNYITFYADANTRASLLTTNYIEQPFGVYGYKYDFSSTWNGQRAMAVPNVFWNLKGSTKVPLKVSYNGGLYEYNAAEGSPNRDGSGQVNWSSSRYAFWAYYPYEDYSNPYFNSYFTVSGMEQEGAPNLTYTVDRGTFGANGDVTTYGSTSNMYDVMTGGISQVTAASSGNTVTFTMYHRLSAVDVSINNAYQHEYQVDGVNYTEDVDIVITDLKLHFENLKYSEAKIFLERDKSIPALNTVLTAPTKSEDGETVLDPSQMVANYQLIGGTDPDIGPTVTVGPTTSKFNLTTEAGATMTFIPQETSDLRVTADISYHMVGATSGAQISKLRVNDEGEPLDSEGNVTDDPSKFIYDNAFTITKTTDFKQPLVETTRYFIVLNFTSEAVSINIITADAWDERTVDYEFM
jgi:hypothetical protein